MKIAMIGQKGMPATYGGVERHVEELGARLVGMGHEVTAYCRKHYTENEGEHRGIRLRVLPSIATKHLDAISHTALAVAHAVRHGFDVIHFHAIGPAGLSFVPRILPRRRPAVVATLHGLDWRRRKWNAFARWCLRRSAWVATHFPHRTIVVSKLMADYFAARGRKTIHIPNGVEAPDPQPIDELARFGVRQGGFILWVGRFVPEKRVEDAIAAFKGFPVHTRLLLAGPFDETDPYVAVLLRQAGRDPRIIFSGGLYGRAKSEALANAAAVVQTSEMEGFPIALLEGMRYGRPVIASDIPEHLEAVDPGGNGFIYPVGNVAALRERIAWVLAHADEAAAAGRLAARDATRYDWDNIARETAAVYEDLRKGGDA